MSNVVNLPLPELRLEFDVTQKQMTAFIKRAEKIGVNNRIEFVIVLTAPNGDTLTIRSSSSSPMEEHDEKPLLVAFTLQWIRELFGIKS